MKKSRKGVAKKRKAKSANPQAAQAESPPRRAALRSFAKFGLIAAVVAGGGVAFVADVRETLAEEDLSRIGGGVPTVVQVHDPSCPTCRALQKEARAALADFEDGEIQYLVANLSQDDGRAFANQHGVEKITLVIFDRNGRRRQILRGPSTRERLKTIFAGYANRPASTEKPEPPAAAPSSEGPPRS